MTNDPGVRLRGVTKLFGKFRAVDGVSLDVWPGDFFGLLGPNGAGKSTTIRMITGLARPTSGTIEILGRDVRRDPVGVRRLFGLVGEELAVFERLTAEEFLHFAGRMYDLAEEDVQRRTDELLELLDLSGHRHRLKGPMAIQ